MEEGSDDSTKGYDTNSNYVPEEDGDTDSARSTGTAETNPYFRDNNADEGWTHREDTGWSKEIDGKVVQWDAYHRGDQSMDEIDDKVHMDYLSLNEDFPRANKNQATEAAAENSSSLPLRGPVKEFGGHMGAPE